MLVRVGRLKWDFLVRAILQRQQYLPLIEKKEWSNNLFFFYYVYIYIGSHQVG